MLIAAGSEAFAGALGYAEAVTIPLLGGVVPTTLVAARSRGELVPGRVLRAIGHPAVALAVGTLFLAGANLHALVIWDGLLERAAAAIAVAMVALSVAAWRRGASRPRTVIALRREPEPDLGRMTVTAATRPSTIGNSPTHA